MKTNFNYWFQRLTQPWLHNFRSQNVDPDPHQLSGGIPPSTWAREREGELKRQQSKSSKDSYLYFRLFSWFWHGDWTKPKVQLAHDKPSTRSRVCPLALLCCCAKAHTYWAQLRESILMIKFVKANESWKPENVETLSQRT